MAIFLRHTEPMESVRQTPVRLQPVRGVADQNCAISSRGTSLIGGRYLMEHLLGQGGMGAVYFARDRQANNAPVALKVMQVQLNDPERQRLAVEQFRQEAQLLSTLNHPGLARVSHYFVEHDRYYLVMNYIEGKNLAHILEERGEPFPVNQVLEWAVQLLNILEYLHSCNPPVIFRDLKPSNLILGADGRLHMVDFGIARILVEGSKTNNFLKGIGSPDYCPLEQYQGGGTDQRTDLYALGATLYHLLTFRPPPLASEVALAGRPVNSPRRYNPQVNSPLEDLVVKLLELRKEDRFSTVGQVRAALAKARLGQQRRKRKGSKTGPVSRPLLSGPVLLAALSLLMLALLAWLGFKMHG